MQPHKCSDCKAKLVHFKELERWQCFKCEQIHYEREMAARRKFIKEYGETEEEEEVDECIQERQDIYYASVL